MGALKRIRTGVTRPRDAMKALYGSALAHSLAIDGPNKDVMNRSLQLSNQATEDRFACQGNLLSLLPVSFGVSSDF